VSPTLVVQAPIMLQCKLLFDRSDTQKDFDGYPIIVDLQRKLRV
jgi:hypothetical protein